MPHTLVNGVSMFYRLEGPADAPCVTFSNSLCCDTGMWEPQAAALAQKYRVLRYDVRGHGGTAASVGPYSFPMLIGDVVALWDALGIKRSHWIGLSLGGMTGFGLALAHPGRLASLVCCDCRADAPAAYADFMGERIRITREQGMGALVEPTISRWFLPETMAAAPAYIDGLRNMIRSTTPEGHIGCCEAIRTLAYGARLGEIRVPTLLVGGESDVGAPPEVMREIAAAIPGARFQMIEHAGHIANLENTASFNAAITSFLASVG